MTVGQQKQKWTVEEEAALRAGVEKYGAGKWRAIQKDEEFGPVLMSRSNVDLKDKWRNISATTSGNRNSRSKNSAQKSGRRMMKILDSGADSSPSEVIEPEKKVLGARYENYIIEAINTQEEPDGSSVEDIGDFIEEQQNVPAQFKKQLIAKLKAMVAEGKLIKVHQNYKINGEFPSSGRSKFQRPSRSQQLDEKPSAAALAAATGLGFPLHHHQQQQQYYHLHHHQQQQQQQQQQVTKKLRTDSLAKKGKLLDIDAARTAAEAARAAAMAVAEAEAAAAAAEIALKEAEEAELQAEVAQQAADVAFLAARRKPPTALATVTGGVAVTV